MPLTTEITADGQEGQQFFYEEEEEEYYYIEEEIEESVEEDLQTYDESHCVETIKEVSSDQENQSPEESNQNNVAMIIK